MRQPIGEHVSDLLMQFRPGTEEQAKHSFDDGCVQIIEQGVPVFVEQMLESLYENIYCSVARFAIYDCLEDVCTYLSLLSGKPDCVLLFRIAGPTVIVINQQISLETEQIKRFCTTVFERYPSVAHVRFHALRASIAGRQLALIYQEVPIVEENIVVLPESTAQYLKAMPAQSRGRILKSIRKAKSDNASYEFEVLERSQIAVEHVDAIARLAAQRMLNKGSEPYLDEREVQAMARLAQTHGSLGLIRIEGRLVAGTLSYRVGTRWFSRVIAHDPALNRYGLGNQLQLQVILNAIDRGAREFWMMGGGSTDKARFLAQRTMLNSISVYRSRSAVLGAWRSYAANDLRRGIFSFKESVKTLSGEDSLGGRTMAGMLSAARALKHAGRRVGHLARHGPGHP